MVKCLPEFEYFTVFLKNRNFTSKIRISNVTDYAALSWEASVWTKNVFKQPQNLGQDMVPVKCPSG